MVNLLVDKVALMDQSLNFVYEYLGLGQHSKIHRQFIFSL